MANKTNRGKKINFGFSVILLVLSTFSVTDADCVSSRDIAILLDGSRSMGQEGFTSIKQYAIDMMDKMDVGPDKARVGVILITLHPTAEFDLKSHPSIHDLENATSQILYHDGGTGIEEGLNVAAEELSNEQRGARFNATKFMIVFSDGDFPLFSPYPTMNSVHILVIGSGPNVFRDKLAALVKDPSKDFFFINDPPESVVKRMDDWTKDICNNA